MDYANETNIVRAHCAIASPELPSTQTCATYTSNREQSIFLVPAHHANPLPSKENAKEALTSETVSPQFYELLEEASPNSFVSKTCPDYYQPPLFPEANPAHIFNRCSRNFTPVGMMRNGVLSEQPSLKLSGEAHAFYLLPRPGALSWSGNGRPPGTTKSEAQAKKLGIIQKNEVFNPEWLEQKFGLPIGWTDPQECRAAIELLALVEPLSEISSTPDSPRSPSGESCTSIPSSDNTIIELQDSFKLKAISLWQPWASLIPLGLKHYETRSWKTDYRGKLLICSTAGNSKQHKEYLKICNELKLPPWENFLHGCAIALCDLTDCIKMTDEFLQQQSRTEILCGDWQVGRYAWKLENIQPIAEPFAVKGKQGLFDISLQNHEFSNQGERENPEPETHNLEPLTSDSQLPTPHSPPPTSKKSDRWYTPLLIVNRVEQVLGVIDLDPCADEGKHIPAKMHYTAADDGLSREWHGRVFMNPPYSCPGKWMKKLQVEYESGRVTEAIALVPVATDTKWLSPVLRSQPVCFWTGRIKFLDVNYQPKLSARQAHCLVYWGDNWQRFKEVFDEYGVVQLPLVLTSKELLGDKETSPSNLISPSKKRLWGEGNGYIHWRTITKNGKDYSQAYYHWKENGKKRTKYIPQHLLQAIQVAEQQKCPVIEILELLGVGSSSQKLLGDTLAIAPKTDATQDNEDSLSNYISPSKIRREKGEGSGTIHWRTITKNGKDYPQAYYHYEFWSGGDRLTKSSRYIPKRLLTQVQQLDADKAPVREILQVLGELTVFTSGKRSHL